MLGRDHYEHGAAPGGGYRNGSRKAWLKTAAGIVEYSAPQVAGRDEPWRSAIAGHLRGYSEQLEGLADMRTGVASELPPELGPMGQPAHVPGRLFNIRSAHTWPLGAGRGPAAELQGHAGVEVCLPSLCCSYLQPTLPRGAARRVDQHKTIQSRG